MKNFYVVSNGTLNINTKEDIQDKINKKNIYELNSNEEVEEKCNSLKDTDIILFIKKKDSNINIENIINAIKLFKEYNDPIVPIRKIERRNLVSINSSGVICSEKPYVNFNSIEFREPLSDITFLVDEDWVLTNKYKLLAKQYMPVRGLCIND